MAVTVTKRTDSKKRVDHDTKDAYGRELELSDGITYRFAAITSDPDYAKRMSDNWERSLLKDINAG